MKPLFQILYLELKKIFDIKTVFFLMVLSIFLYAFLMPQPSLNKINKNVPLVVIDKDNSDLSHELIQFIDASETIKVTKIVDNLNDAQDLIFDQQTYRILVIPSQFQQNLQAGKENILAFYSNGNHIMLHDYTTMAINDASQALIDKSGFSGVISTPQLKVTPVALFNPQESYAAYIIPPELILILQQTLIIGCMLLGMTEGKKQQEQIVIRQYGATLYAALTLIIGKIIACLVLYLFYLLFYMIFIAYIYEIPRLGNINDILFVGLPFILAATLLGIIGGFLIKRPESAFILLLPLSLPFFFMSGILWPIESMAPIMQQLRLFIPSTAATDALVRVNQMGVPASALKDQLINLWILVIVYGVLALFLGRYSLKKSAKRKMNRTSESAHVILDKTQ